MIKPESFELDSARENLYFGRYKYRCTVRIYAVHLFKDARNAAEIQQRLSDLNQRVIFTWELPLSISSTNDIEVFVRWKTNHESQRSSFNLMITRDTASVYSNDITIIQSLSNDLRRCDPVVVDSIKLHYSQTRPDYESGVLYRKNPKHRYRMYLQSRRYSQIERQELAEFLSEQEVSVGESLAYWLDGDSSRIGIYWSLPHLSFDYDDECIATLVALKFNDTIRKIYRIVQK